MSNELEDVIHRINNQIKERYQPIFKKDKERFRADLENYVGKIQEITPLSQKEQRTLRGKIVSVDGSINRIGGNYPHYADLCRGVCFYDFQHQIMTTDFLSPLLQEVEMENAMLLRDAMLAKVELEAALKAFDDRPPRILLMDGSLIRYAISAKDHWDQLKEKALAHQTIIVGVIEDIKTNIIAQLMPDMNESIYDRELMYDQLAYKEALFIKPRGFGKNKYDIATAFVRSSLDPVVIGIDMLEEQMKSLEYVLQLLLCLTPKHTRGIPSLIDFADQACKIKSVEMEQLFKNFLEPSVYTIFFQANRDKRGN